MSVRRVAVFSVHTSPLAQPGAGDGGGMNVYVRALASALARAGVECDVFTRARAPRAAAGRRGRARASASCTSTAGPRAPVPKHDAAGARRPVRRRDRDGILDAERPVDVLHANYWLSGAVAHRLKHDARRPAGRDVPHARPREGRAGVDDDPGERARVEHEVIALRRPHARVDRPTSASSSSTLYDADPDRIEIVPPGVDHAVFSPGDSRRRPAPRSVSTTARRCCSSAASSRSRAPTSRCAASPRSTTRPRCCSSSAVRAAPTAPPSSRGCTRSPPSSGVARPGALRAAPAARPARRLTTAPPTCASCRRAPSRSGSSRSRPPRAARRSSRPSVGGLRSLVDDGDTGFLVDGRDPRDFAAPVAQLLADPRSRREMGASAAARSRRYSWSITAARLRRLYGDLVARGLVAATDVDADVDARRSTSVARDARSIAAHLEGPVAREPWVQTVEYDPEIPRWYVRFGCDGRDAATIYFDLHQRTLRYEVYFLPDPPRGTTHELYRFLLRRNHTTYGAHFSIGPDGDVLSRRSRAARAPRRRRARPHHRRALRARRAVVPARDRIAFGAPEQRAPVA